ncbi:hypothetical protein OEZ86_003886 [Tetradesmus obliquus]|nr:hypothetical protein OEZ86_003886 [Tetradesmus obliquus]
MRLQPDPGFTTPVALRGGLVSSRPNMQLGKAFIRNWIPPNVRAAWEPLELPVQVLTWSSSSSSSTAAAAAAGAAAAVGLLTTVHKAARKSASNAVVRAPAAAAAAAAGAGCEGGWREAFRFNGRIALCQGKQPKESQPASPARPSKPNTPNPNSPNPNSPKPGYSYWYMTGRATQQLPGLHSFAQAFAGWRVIGASGAADFTALKLFLWQGPVPQQQQQRALQMQEGVLVRAGAGADAAAAEAAAAAALGKRQREDEQQQQQQQEQQQEGKRKRSKPAERRKTPQREQWEDVQEAVPGRDCELQREDARREEVQHEQERDLPAPAQEGKRYRRMAAAGAAAAVFAAAAASDDSFSGGGWSRGDAPIPSSHSHRSRSSSSSSDEDGEEEVEQQQQQHEAAAGVGAVLQLPRSLLRKRHWLAEDGTVVFAKDLAINPSFTVSLPKAWVKHFWPQQQQQAGHITLDAAVYLEGAPTGESLQMKVRLYERVAHMSPVPIRALAKRYPGLFVVGYAAGSSSSSSMRLYLSRSQDAGMRAAAAAAAAG